MRIYRNLHAWRFLCVFDVHLGVSRSREKLVHTFEQNCSKLTYAFQNLKRRSRPIVSGDFCRSPSFADPPRWADKKNRSAHIGADRIQVSLLFALRIPQVQKQGELFRQQELSLDGYKNMFFQCGSRVFFHHLYKRV